MLAQIKPCHTQNHVTLFHQLPLKQKIVLMRVWD